LQKSLGEKFWQFLAVSFLFDSGMFIFFLLYNLYLLDLGFHEDFVGWTTSAMTFGAIVGSLPCGWFAHRFNLRNSLLVCFCLVPTISALRAASSSAALLIVLAFLAGLASSLWAVAVPPVVAQITNERNRDFGFSLVFASGIGFGALAGLVGGQLPGWLYSLSFAHNPIGAKRAALMVACGLAALALWPASRLNVSSAALPGNSHYPWNGFVKRYFPALAVWSFATGAFSPFFNVYFSQSLTMPVERIGGIFAGAQLVQVAAILLAPAAFRKCGLVTGIMFAQFGCALALAWLASEGGGWRSAAAYASYTGFQWMSEPGMYTLLMSRVRREERAGASALSLLVISVARAIAAAIAGVAFAQFGYPAVMAAISFAILVSGAAFGLLLRRAPAVF
jgi:MFS family permease